MSQIPALWQPSSLCVTGKPCEELIVSKAHQSQPNNSLVSEVRLLAIQITPPTGREKLGQMPNPLKATLVLKMALSGTIENINWINHSR